MSAKTISWCPVKNIVPTELINSWTFGEVWFSKQPNRVSNKMAAPAENQIISIESHQPIIRGDRNNKTKHFLVSVSYLKPNKKGKEYKNSVEGSTICIFTTTNEMGLSLHTHLASLRMLKAQIWGQHLSELYLLILFKAKGMSSAFVLDSRFIILSLCSIRSVICVNVVLIKYLGFQGP